MSETEAVNAAPETPAVPDTQAELAELKRLVAELAQRPAQLAAIAAVPEPPPAPLAFSEPVGAAIGYHHDMAKTAEIMIPDSDVTLTAGLRNVYLHNGTGDVAVIPVQWVSYPAKLPGAI